MKEDKLEPFTDFYRKIVFADKVFDVNFQEIARVLFNEVDRLNSIIKEVREWAKKCSCQFTNDDGELVVSEISFNIQARPCDLFKILDKVGDEK